MRHLGLIAAVLFASCDRSTPAWPKPPPPPPRAQVVPAAAPGPEGCGAFDAEGRPVSAEQCRCLGLAVVPDRGDGGAACPEGQGERARVRLGVEGAVCCGPAPTRR